MFLRGTFRINTYGHGKEEGRRVGGMDKVRKGVIRGGQAGLFSLKQGGECRNSWLLDKF
jgi:hypothetical protein